MTRAGVAVMAALLVVYLAFSVWYAVVLFRVATPLAIALGVALLVLPLLGAAFLVAEVRFGIRAERLGARLDAEGGIPEEELPASPSGRVDRAAADALFPRFRADAEANPGDWRAWYRLGLAYDAAGDRRRARGAVREAIRLSRSGTPRS